MTIIYHTDVIQRSEAWYQLRCGLLTASEMKFILTPTLKTAANDKSRAHIWELAAQRINNYVEPSYESFDMARGKEDELDAKILYNEHYGPLHGCGFITNDRWGFTIGYSPDALADHDGQIEVKSHCQKWQTEIICDFLPVGKIPPEDVIQVQTGLLVSERSWCDYVPFGNGQPMPKIRVEPDLEVHKAIIEAAALAEKDIADKITRYNGALAKFKCVPTIRKNRSEDIHL